MASQIEASSRPQVAPASNPVRGVTTVHSNSSGVSPSGSVEPLPSSWIAEPSLPVLVSPASALGAWFGLGQPAEIGVATAALVLFPVFARWLVAAA